MFFKGQYLGWVQRPCVNTHQTTKALPRVHFQHGYKGMNWTKKTNLKKQQNEKKFTWRMQPPCPKQGPNFIIYNYYLAYQNTMRIIRLWKTLINSYIIYQHLRHTVCMVESKHRSQKQSFSFFGQMVKFKYLICTTSKHNVSWCFLVLPD